MVHIYIDRVQIDTGFCLRCQALHTGFDWTSKEQTLHQRIGHGGGTSGVAAYVPGMTHHGDSLLVAHADELFTIIVTHISDVKGDVGFTRLPGFIDVVGHGHTTRRAHGDTVRVATSFLDELAEAVNFTLEVLEWDHDRHP